MELDKKQRSGIKNVFTAFGEKERSRIDPERGKRNTPRAPHGRRANGQDILVDNKHIIPCVFSRRSRRSDEGALHYYFSSSPSGWGCQTRPVAGKLLLLQQQQQQQQQLSRV